MKRFAWGPQRVLDVAVQRERAMRIELFALSGRMASVRQEAISRRSVTRTLLQELGQAESTERLGRQQLLLDAAAGEERAVAKLDETLERMRRERTDKTKKLMELKVSREGLERLRAGAVRRYRKQRERFEQKRLDDSAAARYARAMPHAHAAGG